MKGFIEINEVGSSKAMLINVACIESVVQSPERVRIYMTSNIQYVWTVEESYEEIVNKIEKAVEG